MVLWAVVLLSALTTSFSASTRNEMNLARNAVENARAEALADAGLHRVILTLLDPTQAGSIRADDTPYSWSFGDGEVKFAVQNEEGKIDLNQASEALLRALFQAAGADEAEAGALAAAVIDFRDADGNAEAGGAEDFDYRSAGLAFEAKDASFEHVGELAQVFGMTPAMLRRVTPAITIHSQRPEPDLDVAPLLVRDAMALYGPGDGEGNALTNSSALLPGLSREQLELDEGITDPGELRRTLGQSVYTIHSEGRTAGGSIVARSAIVLISDASELGFIVRSWGQGPRRLFATAATLP